MGPEVGTSKHTGHLIRSSSCSVSVFKALWLVSNWLWIKGRTVLLLAFRTFLSSVILTSSSTGLSVSSTSSDDSRFFDPFCSSEEPLKLEELLETSIFDKCQPQSELDRIMRVNFMFNWSLNLQRRFFISISL